MVPWTCPCRMLRPDALNPRLHSNSALPWNRSKKPGEMSGALFGRDRSCSSRFPSGELMTAGCATARLVVTKSNQRKKAGRDMPSRLLRVRQSARLGSAAPRGRVLFIVVFLFFVCTFGFQLFKHCRNNTETQ